jgi:hypothetical protein
MAGYRRTNRALERHFDALLREAQRLMNPLGVSAKRKPA